ncbi:unnamed protein product [Closterium sp. NIES-53]
MEVPSSVPLPFLDLQCSSKCPAGCDGIHISWKAQETAGEEVQRTAGASEWEPADGSSSYARVPLGVFTVELTSSITKNPLPPCGMHSTATESAFNELLQVETSRPDVIASFSESGLLHVGAMTHVSISESGGYVSMLTQPSLIDLSFTQMAAAAVVPSPLSSHDQSHSVVMASAAAAPPICEPPQKSMPAPAAPHHQIHQVLSTPAATALSICEPPQQCMAAPFAAHRQIHSLLSTPGAIPAPAAAPPAAAAVLPVNVPSAAFQSHFLQQEAPLSLRSAQATSTQSSGGSTRVGTPLAATREGSLYDMIVSGGFKDKGSASWWGDDLIPEAPAMQPQKKQCLMVGGDGVGFKRPDNGSTGSASPAAGSQASAPLSSWPQPAPIPAIGSTVRIAGSAAVSRPPAAATEGATVLDPLSALSAASREAAWPADLAQPTQKDQVDGKGLGLERLPIQRRSAAEKLRRHRISAGFKRLEKVLPPSWMRQKHKSNLSSRTDMASLLASAVDFIRELEDRKAQLAQAYTQQV